MTTPKGLTRKITRKQALSYQRLVPNGIGVTAISSVNGRGAYARKAKTPKRRGPLTAAERFQSKKAQIKAARAWASTKTMAQWRKSRRPAKHNRPFRPPSASERLAETTRPGTYTRVMRKLKGMGTTAKRAAVAGGDSKLVQSASGYKRALKPLKKAGRATRRVIDAAKGGYRSAYVKARQLLGGRTVRGRKIVGMPVVGVGAETVHEVRRAKRTRRTATKTERTMKRSRGKRRTAAQKRATKKMLAGLRRYRAAKRSAKRSRTGSAVKATTRKRHKKATPAQLKALKKAWRAAKAARIAKGYKGNKKAAKRKTAKRRKSAARRGYSPISVRLGKRSVRTYLYKGKGGRAKHVPLWAETGAKSARQFTAATRAGTKVAGSKTGARIRRRVAAIMRARGRAAARVQRAGDIFTPNRGRAIPFTTWSESMRSNKKRKSAKRSKRKAGKKLTKHQIRVRAGKKAARTRKRHQAAKAAPRRKASRKSASRRKASRKPRKAAKRRSPRKSKRMHENRRRHVRRHDGRRRRRVRRYDENRRSRRSSYLPIRVARFEENMRMHENRKHRRKYKRNSSAFMSRFQGMLKVGLLAGAGFMGHRAVTKIVSDNVLSQVPQLTTGTLAPYRNLIAGLLTAVGGMFAVDKFAKKQAAEVNAGIFVSLIQSAVTTVLTQMGQGQIAAALSAYPDATGPARGYGEYLPVSGFGDIPQRGRYGGSRLSQASAGLGVVPMLTQAAAGYGAAPQLTQAAAGYGAAPQLTQAAAGVGEFIAQNLEGYGDYEMVAGMGSPELTDEGIKPDLATAEHALDIAEAAAGLGDIGSRSQLNPPMVAQAISQSPSGMRAGVFNTADGIFGK